MSFLIEAIPPERAFVVVSHVIAFAAYVFENMGARSALCCFKSQWVELGVGLAALC